MIFFLSAITDNSKHIQERNSGGPVIKIIDNTPCLIGLIKRSLQNITNSAAIFIGVGISKQFKGFDETIYSNQQDIINDCNYAIIFKSWQNHRNNITGSPLNRIEGLYVGNPQVSPNTQLKLMFSRDYCYLIYKFIAENADFNRNLENWIENNNLPVSFKMAVLFQMVT